VIQLVEFHLDETTTAWFGAADVACDIIQVARDAAAAGMPPVPGAGPRSLADYLLQVRRLGGRRRGAARITTSRGQYDEAGQHHRLDFVGVSKLAIPRR